MSGPIPGHRVEFQRRTLKVPLYGGDWQQRINNALAAVAAAEKKYHDAKKRESTSSAPRLLHEMPESETLKVEWDQRIAEHDALVAEADEAGKLVVTLQALRRREWANMLAKHPPRTDESVPEDKRKMDAEIGANDDTLAEDLVPASIIDLSEPDLSVDDLLDGVSAAQWDLLYGAAFALNRDVGSAPKALSSRTLTSDAT